MNVSFGRAPLLVGLMALLASCSTATPPVPAPDAGGPTLVLRGTLSGRSVENDLGRVTVAPQDTSGEGAIVVSASGIVPAVPPVEVVHSSFIMAEVEGARPVGAWHVQVSAPAFDNAAALTVKRGGGDTLSAQDLSGSVTELFRVGLPAQHLLVQNGQIRVAEGVIPSDVLLGSAPEMTSRICPSRRERRAHWSSPWGNSEKPGALT